MKKVLTKKFASLFLTLTMVISCVSIGIVPAYASTYDISQLETLMDSFEAKMNGTIYSNMSTGYDAWYNAYKVYIGVKAGLVNESEIDTAYTTLESAINSMTNWNAYTGTAVGSFSGDSTKISAESPNPSGAYQNLLYSSEISSSVGSVTAANVVTNMYYSPTVMLYDGITAPKMGLMGSAVRNNNSKTRYLYSLYPCVSTSNQSDFGDLALESYWKSPSWSNTMDFTWCYWQSDTSAAYNYATGNNGISANSTSHRTIKLDSIIYVANAMTFTGSLSSNEYSKVLNPAWYSGTGDSPNSDVGTFTTSSPIYVVNYKSLVDAMKVSALSSITTYSYSTAKALLNAIDSAENLNPNSYFTSVSNVSDSVNNCANAISSSVASINTAQNNMETVDYDSSLTLANYYGSRTALYNENNSSAYYTEDSFANFKTAYEDVTTTFNKIYSGESHFTDATPLYNNLVSAYTSLEQAASYIVDTELQAMFDTYHDLKVSYYLPAGIETLNTTVNSILNYYNNGDRTLGITLTESDENQAIYNNLVSSFSNSLSALRFSSDLSVNANGNFESINQVIARAETIDAKDYSNGITLTAQIVNARNYKTAMETELFTNQSTQYTNYVNAVKALDSAISSLQLSFAKLANGEEISKVVSSTDSTQAGSGKIYFSMKDATTSTVLFKTVASSQTFTVPYNITVDNDWSYYSWPTTYRAGARICGLGYGSSTAPVDNQTVTATNGESCTVNLNWYDNTANDGMALSLSLASGANLTYHQALMQGSNTGSFLDAVSKTYNQMVYGNVTFTVPSRSENSAVNRTYTITTPTLYAYAYVDDSHGGKYLATDTNDVVSLTVVDVSDLFSLIDNCENLVTNTLGNTDGTYTPSSWSNFETAFTNSKVALNYKTMDTNSITTEIDARYNNLTSALKALRKTANYSALDSLFSTRTTERNAVSNAVVNGTSNPMAPTYLTYSNGKVKNYLDINFDMVKTIATAENGNSFDAFTSADGETFYNIRSLAYYDKALSKIYEDSNAASDSANASSYIVSNSNQSIRKTQNQFANGSALTLFGSTYYEDSTNASTIQSKIDERTNVLNSLSSTSIESVDSISSYESFDSFINDIKNTDFSVYDNEKATEFKQKAYEYLTNGVYVVDQQLFSSTASSDDTVLNQLAYDGSSAYYTGLGSVDSKSIDAVTTELLTMYNDLTVDSSQSNVSHVKTFTVTTNIFIDGIATNNSVNSFPVGSTCNIAPSSIDSNVLNCDLLTYGGSYTNSSGVFTPLRISSDLYSIVTIGDNITLNFYYQTPASEGDITISVYDRAGKCLSASNVASGTSIDVNGNEITINGKVTTATLHTGGFTFVGWTYQGAVLEEGSTVINKNASIQAKYSNNGDVLYNVGVTDSNGINIPFDITQSTVSSSTNTTYTGTTAIAYNSSISFSSSNPNFIAWLVETSSGQYTPLSYNPNYSGKVYGNMKVVEMTSSTNGSNFGLSADTQNAINKGTPFIFVRSSFETNIAGNTNANNSLDLITGEIFDNAISKVTYCCRYTPLSGNSNCTVIKTGMINMNPTDYATYGVSSDESMFRLNSENESGNLLTDLGVITTFAVSNVNSAGQYTITTAKLNFYRRAFVTYSTVINSKTVYVTEYSQIINPIS